MEDSDQRPSNWETRLDNAVEPTSKWLSLY